MDDRVIKAVDRVLGGDVDAYAEIVGAYQQEVWKVVAFALRDRAGTEDLVQQVFVNAYLRLDRYDRHRGFGAWIRTIARNAVRNELRRGGREHRWLNRYRDFFAQRMENNRAADEAEQTLREFLEDCRKQLSDSAANAIAMRYEQGLKFDEIAGVLGRTVAATRQMLSRIRAALRKCVEEKRAHA